MGMKAWAVAVVAALGAGGAAAGGLAPVGTVSVVPVPVVAPVPRQLEWLRIEGPRMGRDVLVQAASGATVPTILWHNDIQVRVRTESGVPLTEPELAAVRQEALTCRRGEVQDVSDRIEFNGTYVVDYDCAWFQGAQ